VWFVVYGLPNWFFHYLRIGKMNNQDNILWAVCFIAGCVVAWIAN